MTFYVSKYPYDTTTHSKIDLISSILHFLLTYNISYYSHSDIFYFYIDEQFYLAIYYIIMHSRRKYNNFTKDSQTETI